MCLNVEEVVGIEHGVAQKVEGGTVESIGSALGHHGDHAVRGAAEFRSNRVSFDAELLYRVLRRYIRNRVDVAVVDGAAIDELRPGVRDASRNLIVSSRKSVAVHSRYRIAGLCSTLGHNPWRNGEEVENIS